MNTELDFSQFEMETLESRELFAAAAVPHHLINLNLPLDLSLQVNNPTNGQHIINLNLPADLSLHVNQPNLSGLLQPITTTVSTITTPVVGLADGVVSPLLGTVTGLLGSVLAIV
ncbi:hypothetical protein A7K93_09230 [Candidatus Methylacidiphilum fumarolicum]|uniref:Uncharacterized protein n=2 Tax=Candidatus Methylacidiphilum fumarolicum TaxID=591154 RepID=I0JZE7_METFB|nr:hypothetical protein [Candidatus Methylacidiphilum fumarolicum]MBW6415777.1 hypothetical protein [Candidatus Methylacidiphilum fumarolicum]TFE66832.1 hypothetical protein A7K73_09755 [Candidatus Methylacidiphilum fumarolicum]TFE72273.1 hypothetical protein A7K93_09230 [Candidatus Methylacidiphilum fumarolicum]TFE72488.1 hypothetical protein A7K72_08525 [Candidatus Methylacidiphilum fumarolicum]TFE77661.1 hypothetical protein A7D33_03655 [Candidatus Methylacidiphilum fumarolicum]